MIPWAELSKGSVIESQPDESPLEAQRLTARRDVRMGRTRDIPPPPGNSNLDAVGRPHMNRNFLEVLGMTPLQVRKERRFFAA